MALVKSLTLQTQITSGSGTNRVASWSGSDQYSVLVVPASVSQVERAQLAGQIVTHTAVIPRGLALTPNGHRFVDGSDVYRVVGVTDTPRETVALLELQS